MRWAGGRGLVGAVVLILVSSGGRASGQWVPVNGGNPVDTGQDVTLGQIGAYQAMPTLRMGNGSGVPDDLVYTFRTGLKTVAGRLRGQKLGGSGPIWEILGAETNEWTCDAAAWPDYRTGWG